MSSAIITYQNADRSERMRVSVVVWIQRSPVVYFKLNPTRSNRVECVSVYWYAVRCTVLYLNL